MTFLNIVFWIVAIIFGLFILGWMNAIRASFVRNRKIDKMIRPALDAVKNSSTSANELIAKLMEFPAARNIFYIKLQEMEKADIFPKAYRSIEKIAESDLARWLMHPNELKTSPAEMELIKEVPVTEKGKSGKIFLFRFRTDADHWASKYDWMTGIAGPYEDDGEQLGITSGAFSELTRYDSMTEDEHIEFLKKALKKKGLIVPS